MFWPKLTFSEEHRGKTLPQVMFSDPDWFFWAMEQGIFEGRGNLKVEAQDIYKKARSIRIPQAEGEDLVAEYYIYPILENFSKFEIVPRARPIHNGGNRCFRRDVIDMTVVRKMQDYDKLGYKRFIWGIKDYVFRNSDIRMTKRRCEEFFSNDENFVLPPK